MAVSTKEKPDLEKKVHEVPHKPGVYLMRDRFNRVIYVGKARDLRKRVGSYFLPSKLAQADLKTRAMLDATWDFETYTVRSEAEGRVPNDEYMNATHGNFLILPLSRAGALCPPLASSLSRSSFPDQFADACSSVRSD